MTGDKSYKRCTLLCYVYSIYCILTLLFISALFLRIDCLTIPKPDSAQYVQNEAKNIDMSEIDAMVKASEQVRVS